MCPPDDVAICERASMPSSTASVLSQIALAEKMPRLSMLWHVCPSSSSPSWFCEVPRESVGEQKVMQKQAAIHDSQTPKCIFHKKERTFLQKNAFSREQCIAYRKMRFPADKMLFPAENALPCREMRVFGWQEIAGGLQGSRIKNASQLSQEKKHINLFNRNVLHTTRKPSFQKSREGGRSWGGRCAKFSQVARAKAAQNCWYDFVLKNTWMVQKVVTDLSQSRMLISDDFMQVPLFQCPRLELSEFGLKKVHVPHFLGRTWT